MTRFLAFWYCALDKKVVWIEVCQLNIGIRLVLCLNRYPLIKSSPRGACKDDVGFISAFFYYMTLNDSATIEWTNVP